MGILGNIGSVLGKVGSSVGGWLKGNASSLASGLGGIGATFISNATSKGAQARAYNYARQLQQQQYDLSIQGYKDAPSAQRKGMELAGFNPMLALGNVGNGVSVAGGTPVNGNATDVSGAQQAISHAVQLRNQTNQSDAITDDYYASADLKKIQKNEIVERLPYVSKQAKVDYYKTSMESAKLENDIHYQDELVNYYKESLSNAREIAEIQASAQRYGADRAYNASTYASNISAYNADVSHPVGRILDNIISNDPEVNKSYRDSIQRRGTYRANR